MAATVLSPGSGGSFLDSPEFSHTRGQLSLAGYSTVDSSPPLTKLFIDSSDMEEATPETQTVTSQPNTPDSGFCGVAASTPLKSPESEFSTNVATPPSSGNSRRKRKTVTINESQPTVVVISPDDLFKTYSKSESEREDLQHVTYDDTEPELSGDLDLADISDVIDYQVDSITGWPIKRSDSLESRDNPFVPGGELSREAEDLLSRATVIRDHFYLNEDEKRVLRALQQEWQLQHQQEQQLQQQRVSKHVPTEDNPDGLVQCQPTCGHSLSSLAPTEVLEDNALVLKDNALLQPVRSPGLTAASTNGRDSCWFQSKVNGKVVESLCSQDEGNRPAQTISEDETPNVFVDLQVHEPNIKQRKKCCSMM